MASTSGIHFNIPVREDSSSKISQWLMMFGEWSNAGKIMAITELITRCELPQIRHIMERHYKMEVINELLRQYYECPPPPLPLGNIPSSNVSFSAILEVIRQIHGIGSLNTHSRHSRKGSSKKTVQYTITQSNEITVPEMIQWFIQFSTWTNAERISAIDELIERSEIEQVCHLIQVTQRQSQKDFISLLPKEIVLVIFKFLEAKDLLSCAQTCRSWKVLAEDNLMWREKCQEVGIYELPEIKGPSKSIDMSLWKVAYIRKVSIENNWRTEHVKLTFFKGHKDNISCIWLCGNRIVSGSEDKSLRVWSIFTGKCLRSLKGHRKPIRCVQMSDNIIISGSFDTTVKVWDADTGVCVHTLSGHSDTVLCLQRYGKRVVSGSADNNLIVWDIETGRSLQYLVGHEKAVLHVKVNRTCIVSSSYDLTVKVWNRNNGECVHSFPGQVDPISSHMFIRVDGIHVISSSLRVWNVKTGDLQYSLLGDNHRVTTAMELHNSILVCGIGKAIAEVWDIDTGKHLHTLGGPNKHNFDISDIQITEKFIITSSYDGKIKLWDLHTGEFIRDILVLISPGGEVWWIRADDTKLVVVVGSRNGFHKSKLLVLDFDVE